MKKLYLSDREMELCEVKEGSVIVLGSTQVEIARIVPFDELYPPEPSPFAYCSHAKW